jgi:single-stranded-DNA-specific exonuclease
MLVSVSMEAQAREKIEEVFMSQRQRIWHLLPAPEPLAVRRLARDAQISEVVAQLLWQRGIRQAEEAKQFLYGRLTDLLPPDRLSGVREAAHRIVSAIRGRRKICIYGDYDVDGVTGTAILVRLLQHLQASVEYHIPMRLSEGYGLNAERLRELHQRQVQVVVTVDCGIASIAEAALAQELGMELIITDHHQWKVDSVGAPLLPPAAVVVHPRWPEGHYPSSELSGAGVAFKLAWAIAQVVSGSSQGSLPPDLRDILLEGVGLAALGMVADVVPLRGENRIFVRHGLRRIMQQPSLGLRALMEVAQLQIDEKLTAEDVGYRLAPRLNAAGRLGCARMAVELLTTQSYTTARTHAQFLEKQNDQRQTLERQATQQAKEWVDKLYRNDAAIVVADPRWHPGVVGIVAGRLVHDYGKPAIVIAIREGEDLAVGSGRSIPELPLHEALRACESLLDSYGGHAAAAGLKIAPERIDAFRNAINHYVAHRLPLGSTRPRLLLDAEVPLATITPSLLQELDRLEPYGADNPKPRFLATGVTLEKVRRMGRGESPPHLELRVSQGGQRFRCVAWNMAERYEELQGASQVCLAFTPQRSTYQGYSRIELKLCDIQCGPEPRLE